VAGPGKRGKKKGARISATGRKAAKNALTARVEKRGEKSRGDDGARLLPLRSRPKSRVGRLQKYRGESNLIFPLGFCRPEKSEENEGRWALRKKKILSTARKTDRGGREALICKKNVVS